MESEPLIDDRLYGSRLRGVAIGLAATFAGLAAAELIVGLVGGAASPVVPVGQEVIDVVPKSVRDWAIDWFGSTDKAILILGTLLSLAVIGSLVGTLMLRGSRTAAFSVTIVVGVIGLWAVLMRPAPSFAKCLPPIVGTAVSIAALAHLSRRATAATLVPRGVVGGPHHEPATVAVARRPFLQGLASVVGAGLVVGGIGRLLRRRFDVSSEIASIELPSAQTLPPSTSLPVPTGSPGSSLPRPSPSGFDFGIEGVEAWEVPTDDFYRIDTALVVPQVSKQSWSLRIHGMVERELTLRFDDVLTRPMIERHITLSCVSNEVGGGLVGNARFQGVLLSDLLDEVGVDPEATQVVSRSIDGWTCGSPTSVILDGRDAMLAIAMNGEPLPPEHGYPARLVVPGLYGYVSATKWVTEIELTRWEDFDGYWIPRGWSKLGPVKTMARIDRPSRNREYTVGGAGSVVIGGLAWAVHRGISRVEVAIDDGEWRECELAGVPSDDTWRQWRYDWTAATPGEHVVIARAYDGVGEPQPVGPKSVAPDGAEGYHRVRFSVSG